MVPRCWAQALRGAKITSMGAVLNKTTEASFVRHLFLWSDVASSLVLTTIAQRTARGTGTPTYYLLKRRCTYTQSVTQDSV